MGKFKVSVLSKKNVHILACTNSQPDVRLQWEFETKLPAGSWNKMSSVSGWTSEGGVRLKYTHLFGQLSKGQPSPTLRGDDREHRKPLGLEKYIHPWGFLSALWAIRVNILVYALIRSFCVCSSFGCKHSVIQIAQVSNVHKFTGFHFY